jgi:FkbM family methyltransferase
MADLLDVLDIALLHSASRWSLATKQGRKASAAWLATTYEEILFALKPETFWELGAFDARFSRQLRGKMPRTLYHAFEANPYNYEKFRDAALQDGVNYHHLALGPHDGEVTFNIGRRLNDTALPPVTGSNSILTKQGDRDYEAVTVEMIAVDNFAARHGLTGKSSAVWVDTEGFAYQVLLGMRQTLRSSSCVFVEVEDRQLWQEQKTAVDVRKFLFDEGFVPVLRDFEFSHQYNVLFVRPEICERADVRLILALALQASAE